MADVTTNSLQRTAIPAQDLKRDILESAAHSQEWARSTQEDLEQQGVKLKTSVKDAQLILKQAKKTDKAVDRLIWQAKASKTRRLLDCCCWCCFRRDETSGKQGEGAGSIAVDSTDLDDTNSDAEILVNLDRLKKFQVEERAKSNEKPSWKRTLKPPLSAMNSGQDIWYRQLDASLNQLQQVAEEVNQSLDEQIKLAQMLTIYLNYGVDQVLATNEKLSADKALF